MKYSYTALLVTIALTTMGCSSGGGSDPTTLTPAVTEDVVVTPIVTEDVTEEVVDDYGVDNSPLIFDNIAMNNRYTPLGDRWKDSYSIVADNGKEYCFIESTLDHDSGGLTIQLPEGGEITAEEAREVQTEHPFYRERTEDVDPIYNDLNCGNGPANDFGDENVDQCPGRVDMGKGGCGINGPQFTLVK